VPDADGGGREMVIVRACGGKDLAGNQFSSRQNQYFPPKFILPAKSRPLPPNRDPSRQKQSKQQASSEQASSKKATTTTTRASTHHSSKDEGDEIVDNEQTTSLVDDIHIFSIISPLMSATQLTGFGRLADLLTIRLWQCLLRDILMPHIQYFLDFRRHDVRYYQLLIRFRNRIYPTGGHFRSPSAQ